MAQETENWNCSVHVPPLKPNSRMRTRQIRSNNAIPGIIQLAGGVVTVLVTLGIYTYIFVEDASINRPQPDRGTVLAFLAVVVPAILVVVGSYVQIIRRKRWAMALVLIGGVGNSIVVGLIVGFLFLFTGNIWGQRAVLVDLLAVILTSGIAIANLILMSSAPSKLPKLTDEE